MTDRNISTDERCIHGVWKGDHCYVCAGTVEERQLLDEEKRLSQKFCDYRAARAGVAYDPRCAPEPT